MEKLQVSSCFLFENFTEEKGKQLFRKKLKFLDIKEDIKVVFEVENFDGNLFMRNL